MQISRMVLFWCSFAIDISICGCYGRHTFGPGQPIDASSPIDVVNPDGDVPALLPIDFANLQWAQVHEETSVYSFHDIDCATPNRCVVVGDDGITATSSDFGVTWTVNGAPTNQNLERLSCPSQDVCFAVGDTGAIIRSGDGGNQWELQNSGTGERLMTLSCINPQRCFAGAFNPSFKWLLETSNGGQSWTNKSIAAYDGLGYAMDCHDEVCLLVADYASFFRSVDDGVTWTNYPDVDIPDGDVDCHGEFCVAVGYRYDDSSPLWTSVTSGLSWTASGVESTVKPRTVHCPSTTTCVVPIGKNFLVTTDMGTAWNTIDIPMLEAEENPILHFRDIVCPGLQFCIARQKNILWRAITPADQ